MRSIKDTWLDWYKDGSVQESVAAFAKELTETGARKVLDFGTGTGRHTVYLARMGFEVYGFDWSEAAISIAKQELAKERLSANLSVWDMTELPLPYSDNFFDAVIVVRVLHHTYAEKITCIKTEINRIVREGGYIYVEVPSWTRGENVRHPSAVEVEPGTLIWSDGLEANIPHHHFTLDEMLRMFNNFNLLRLEEMDRHYCFEGMKQG